MNTVRQSLRPKHQVLVLKCYPRFQKNVTEVKPNSSELSYLLYYASTRRSKVQKVGSFLEKKARSDVSRGRTGNVQVTLQILRALIEKSPRDLPLYAPYVLSILLAVLQSKDLSMVEDSVPTFTAFCEHHDVATLAADQSLVQKYQDIVKAYAGFADAKALNQGKSSMSAPLAIRWRSAGLKAIRSITQTEAVIADGGKQLSMIMPVLLQNLYSETEDHLYMLQQKAQINEKTEKDPHVKRRMSMATVQTVDTNTETNIALLSETTADADRMAEEEIGLVALESLKNIFTANSRGQIRLATVALLRFVTSKVSYKRPETAKTNQSSEVGSWATALIEMVARWAPVQDRFIILVTAMESLIRSPVSEANLEPQLIAVTLLGWLLGSSINMIGLSVMDVLLGLIQHILTLLQLGGNRLSGLPYHQQIDAIDLFPDGRFVPETPGLSPSAAAVAAEESEQPAPNFSSPSAARQELLTRLQRCVGDLATHIYYSEQISDMVSAILLRLKPSNVSGLKSIAATIERPAVTAQAVMDSGNLQEDSNTDEFFSFGTARVTALNAVKEILIVANMRGSVTGAGAIGRNKVTIQVWEGTQWLHRDEDRRVRRAYVDALCTWMRLELTRADLRVPSEKKDPPNSRVKFSSGTNGAPGERASTLTRRAVSNPSPRGTSSKHKRSTFMQLLHLAIYDNALESPESDEDMLLSHLLLTKSVEGLGVNAVRSGLPMIMRLQEDINSDSLLPTPIAKLNAGCLVHGYLSCIVDYFGFDTTLVGYEIQSEITRRQNRGIWIEGIRVPPLPLESISSSASISVMQKSQFKDIAKESLKPFDSRAALVDQIASSYAATVTSPPVSPPTSPARVFSMPILSHADPNPKVASLPTATHELPASFKEAMLSNWTKAACINSVERESARTASITGSRSGTNQSGQNGNGYLTVNGHNAEGLPSGAMSPADNEPNILSPTEARRRSSAQENGSASPPSSSDQIPIVRVGDLKKVLAGGSLATVFRYGGHHASSVRESSPLRTTSTAYQDFAGRENSSLRPSRPSRRTSLSTGSDSIVDAEGFESASEGDLSKPMPAPQTPLDSSELAIIYSQELEEQNFSQTQPLPPPAAAAVVQKKSSYEHRRSHSGGRSTGRPRAGTGSSMSDPLDDPEANAKALKGDMPSPPKHVIPGLETDDVPPVPPLPANITMHNSLTLNTRMAQAQSVDETMISPKGNGGLGESSLMAPELYASVGNQSVRSEDGNGNGMGNSVGGGNRMNGSAVLSGRSSQRRKLNLKQLLDDVQTGGDGVDGGGLGMPPY
ncbi:plasma membrane localization protein [Agyrium rufum]|nr:plasma membrane localization protein [Agyrium rufum]